MAGLGAQIARAESLGFTLVREVVCLRKLIYPEHRDEGDARTEAEAERLAAQRCPYRLTLDHARLWRAADGELFATAEPYHLRLGQLDGLAATARELGLRVRLGGMSMYAPGYTLMVLITRPDSSIRVDLGDRTPEG
jgi:hypothetical protein